MKKKPEAKMRRRHPGNVNPGASAAAESFEHSPNPNRYDLSSDFEDDDYGHDPVGVESSFANYYDLFNNSASNDGEEYVDDFEYDPVELGDDYAELPAPAVFNAYPPEVQRKILEWIDRDVRARRDDESRRQDAVLREKISRERLRYSIPVAIIALGILCAAITGIMTKNPVFAIAFLIIPIIIVITLIARSVGKGSS